MNAEKRTKTVSPFPLEKGSAGGAWFSSGLRTAVLHLIIGSMLLTLADSTLNMPWSEGMRS
jgi:hypothetical protein